MTIITYKHGVLACDSGFFTYGGRYKAFEGEKIFVREHNGEEWVFVGAGLLAEIQNFIDCFPHADIKDDNTVIFGMCKSNLSVLKVWDSSGTQDTPAFTSMTEGVMSQYTQGLLDAGMSAQETVEHCIKSGKIGCCSGPVQVFDTNDWEMKVEGLDD